MWFLTPAGLRPGWSTYAQTTNGAFQHVVDAGTGRVLYRHSTTADANGDAFVYDNYPGAARGGKRRVVNFIQRGWLKKGSTFLKGNSVTAFSDVNDDDADPEHREDPRARHQEGRGVPAQGVRPRRLRLLRPLGVHLEPEGRLLLAEEPQGRRRQRLLPRQQLPRLPEEGADLASRRAAGNFEAAGGDPVRLNTLDGADTDSGMPDGNHIDNANMNTPPDGIAPTMQMYLFHAPGATTRDKGDPFVPTTGSFDASVLYHEYTHGLSNRLVVDANGNSTLNDIQPGSMGEAWSDYYAMDYLVTNGLPQGHHQGRRAARGQVRRRRRPPDPDDGHRLPGRRHHARAAPPGSTASPRVATPTATSPTSSGGAEVHGSGEIWGQTLWDLRTRLGHRLTDSLVTRAMSISAPTTRRSSTCATPS